MTTGLRVWTVTGATVSVIVGKSIGGFGCDSETPIVCARFVGIVGGVPSAGRARATSSQTIALCPDSSFVLGVVGLPRTRVLYTSLSPDSVSSVLSPATTASDVMVTSWLRASVSTSS